MRYIYGPVQSRRLGLSLGVSLTPYKVCSFDCLYCQLGKTTQYSTERREYIPLREIVDELKTWFEFNPAEASRLKHITFSGFGEPTLHSRIGELIAEIKKITAVDVVVLTNASLLNDPAVRSSLLAADVLVPSLDAVTQDVFERIDHPAAGISIEEIISGLTALRKEFPKQIWLEVMLVKGVNDDMRYIKKLKAVVELLRPDRLQLNSPVRCKSDSGALPLDAGKLKKIKAMLGGNCEIV